METTIPPAGGTVRVTAADGAQAIFSFPAGTVPLPPPVTFTPKQPSGDRWLTLAISPTGVSLLVPMEVVVQLPETVVLDGSATNTIMLTQRSPLL